MTAGDDHKAHLPGIPLGTLCRKDEFVAAFEFSGAGLNGPDTPKLRTHDLRHTFASMLISAGADVVTVSRQLGHASPDITLRVYAHLFDATRHADRTRGLLEQEFGAILDSHADAI